MSGGGPEAKLTVMTFNVGNGLAPPERLVSYLRQSGADVVGLQELDAAQAEAIARGLADAYPHQILAGGGFTGRGLLSRSLIVEREWLSFSPGRPDLRAVVEVAGRGMTIVVAHPPPPRLVRWGIAFDPMTLIQIERLAAVAFAGAPTILLGDFNFSPRHPSYAQLVAAGMHDAFAGAGIGRGATFPLRPGRVRRVNHRLSWIPLPRLVRFDYVWHTPDLETLAAWVGESTGSDHRPVLARLAPTIEAGDRG